MIRNVLLMWLLLFMVTGTAWAHTGLKQSSPAEDEQINQPVRDIVLDFNTRIGTISTMTVADAEGQLLPLSSVTVDGSRMTGTLQEDLAAGAYRVNWRIAGLDGHIIERSYDFEVVWPGHAAPTTSADGTIVTAEPDQHADQLTVQPAASPSGETGGQPEIVSGNDNDAPDRRTVFQVVALLAGGLLIGIALAWFIIIRKKR